MAWFCPLAPSTCIINEPYQLIKVKQHSPFSASPTIKWVCPMRTRMADMLQMRCYPSDALIINLAGQGSKLSGFDWMTVFGKKMLGYTELSLPSVFPIRGWVSSLIENASPFLTTRVHDFEAALASILLDQFSYVTIEQQHHGYFNIQFFVSAACDYWCHSL